MKLIVISINKYLIYSLCYLMIISIKLIIYKLLYENIKCKMILYLFYYILLQLNRFNIINFSF